MMREPGAVRWTCRLCDTDACGRYARRLPDRQCGGRAIRAHSAGGGTRRGRRGQCRNARADRSRRRRAPLRRARDGRSAAPAGARLHRRGAWTSSTSSPSSRESRRVVAYDQRGHGDSTNTGDASTYTFDQLDDRPRRRSSTIAISRRCDLLGHSMGGIISLRYVLAYPERVRSLVLMDTGGGAGAARSPTCSAAWRRSAASRAWTRSSRSSGSSGSSRPKRPGTLRRTRSC